MSRPSWLPNPPMEFHGYFPHRDTARYYLAVQVRRGHVATIRRNGAGWEVQWRERTDAEKLYDYALTLPVRSGERRDVLRQAREAARDV